MRRWIPSLYWRWQIIRNPEGETGAGVNQGSVAAPRETGGLLRAIITVALVVLVGFAEVVFCLAGFNIWRTCLPMALGGGGILGLVAIDAPATSAPAHRAWKRFAATAQ